MRLHERFVVPGACVFALAALSIVGCTADPPPSTTAAVQSVIASPLPSDLNPVLYASAGVTVGAFTSVSGDVGSIGLNGSVLFDVASSQGFGPFNVLASTVTVNTQASVGHVFGNEKATMNERARRLWAGAEAGAMRYGGVIHVSHFPRGNSVFRARSITQRERVAEPRIPLTLARGLPAATAVARGGSARCQLAQAASGHGTVMRECRQLAHPPPTGADYGRGRELQ